MSGRLRYPLSLVLIVIAFLNLSACAARAVTASDSDADAVSPDLVVYFTSDTRGLLRRCGCSEGQSGGMSARASWLKSVREPGRSIVVDGGDTFYDGLNGRSGSESFRMLKAMTIAEAMGAAGTDASTVGEYDLADGLSFLKDATAGAGFPFLSANLLDCPDGKDCASPFPAYTVKELGGLKVGIIGALDERFPYGSFPASFGGLRVTPQADAVNALADRLRHETDVIVLLGHESIADVKEVAAGLHNVDVIVQGHSQEQLEELEYTGGPVIVKGFLMGKHIGRLALWLKEPDCEASPGRVEKAELTVTLLDESILPDPKVESIISGFRTTLKDRAVAGGGDKLLPPVGYVGPEACAGCHRQSYDNWSLTGHAHAMASLDKTADQFDPDCLPCHTTGYEFSELPKKAVDDKVIIPYKHSGIYNVTCESCHGAGEGHVARWTSGYTTDKSADLVVRDVPEEKCMSCHDEVNSPYFSYEDYKLKGGAHLGPPVDIGN